ncbi:AAA ATPase [Desulfococcus multivorans]|uniref:AAA ATPase n=2 Tax=Desulfococcus multivorans TaxID=897 RepID=S7U7A5_DESML|nr:AAA ATPase [Desulfococcus multivorans]EPR45030.1 AAA ATPase [Desulfococcus multivorans DSM 2059]
MRPAEKDSSPRSTGPAGGQFETKVGTYYALALLANTEPLGLPGAVVDRLEFQRGGQGHPLDDVIVRGATPQGEDRCLEVQVKRSMAFTENDANFQSVVDGIVKARKIEPDRRFAVAIERTTGVIENGVQEALELAQQTIDEASFLRLLETPGRSNKDMRAFVAAFRALLAAKDETGDDVLYDILRSFSVLTFDYARPNSMAEHHDRLRARHLASEKSGADLYDSLFGLVLRADAIGGELNRDELVRKLNDLGVSVGAAPGLAVVRRHIEELSRHALQDIGMTVKGCQLAREKPRRELEGLLQAAETQGGVVEISGPSGVGKSGLLRTAIEAREAVSRILVLAPDRTPSGGWPAMRAVFGIDATADELLSDLACDGGGYLCIDGLDRFRDSAQRKTVIDLLRAALRCPGVTVLFTARPGWEDEGALWIGEEMFAHLSARGRIIVEGLDDDEAEALAKAAPQLAPLLRPDHPAKLLARNLLKLRLLVSTRLNKKEAISEAALARDWQASGAAGTGERTRGEIHSRKRVLNAVANGLIDNAGLVDVSGQDAQAVAELIADEVLVEIHPDRVRFRHDLFTDWAVACVLFDDPGAIDRLGLGAPPPFWMTRGFELACRMLAERSEDEAWPKLLRHLEAEGAAPGWAGLALLALVRSERADALLGRYDAFLLEDDGRRAAQLIRRFVASHTQSAAPLFNKGLLGGVAAPEGMTIPKGPEWIHLILWCLQRFGQLGATPLSAAIDLFQKWLVFAAFGEKTVTPILLDRYADILVAAIERRDLPLPRYGEPLPEIKYAVTGDALDTARLYLALWATTSPGAAARYLNAVKNSKRPEAAISQILEFPGRLLGAAPAEFAAAFLRALEDDEEEDELRRKPGRRRSYAMSRVDGPFVLGRCGIGVFTEILEAAPATGVAFIKTLTESVCAPEEGYPEFSVQFLGTTRRIEALFSYGWSRGRAPSAMLTKALAAMEHWAHRRLDGGETLDAVIGDIIAEGPIVGALWLLIVDLVLSHSSLKGTPLRDVLASPETLAIDAGRANLDAVDRMGGGVLGRVWRSGPAADQAVEKDLAGRVSRSVALHDVIPQLVFNLSKEELGALQAQFEAAVSRLGPWTDDAVDWASPQFMASHALRLASRDNYELVTEKDAAGEERKGWIYKWPPGQKKWLEEGAAKANAEHLTFTRSLAVRFAMDDETKVVNVSAADAEAILDETTAAAPNEKEASHDPNDPWLERVSAAAFLARVGSQEDVVRRRQEIKSIFEQALQFQGRSRTLPRDDVMYDAHSMAIAGRLYLAAISGDEAETEDLLQAVATYPSSAAPAFLRHGGAVEKIDQKLLISLSRIALLACMIPRRAHYGEDKATYDKRRADLESRLASRIEAERQWRKGGAEPDWPTPPPRRTRRRKRTLIIRGADGAGKRAPRESEWPDYYYDEKTGTTWLRILTRLGPSAGSTSKAVMRANRDWLLETNRSGEDGEDDSDIERVWTRGLMDYAAAHARHWSGEMCQELVVDVLKAFSDEAFIDAAAAFIVQSDLHFIEGDAADRAYLLSVREAFWPRLKETWHWRSHLRSSRGGMEINLKELVSAFYMRLYYGFGDGPSYTKGLSDPELTPFIPLLSEIAGEAPSCPTIAHLYLNVLECLDPSTAEGPLAVTAEQWANKANNRFWNELGVGRRVLTVGQKAAVFSDISAWNAVFEALMAAGVTVETEFLERLHGEANQ